MPRNSHARMKQQRAKLFYEQKCLCFWCSRRTVLPEDMTEQERKFQPSNMATLDHLDDKFSPERGHRVGEIRHVMACRKCNQRRCVQSVKENFAEHCRRAQSGHQKKLDSSRSEATPIPSNTNSNAETT